MRVTFATSTLLLIRSIIAEDSAQTLEWVAPPPAGAVGNYSQNAAYVLGDTLSLNWTTPPTSVSLVIYQDGNPNWDRIFYNAPLTSFLWPVGFPATLDPSKENVFYLQLNGPGMSNSHYFNISASVSSTTSLYSTTGPTSISTSPPAPSSTALPNSRAESTNVAIGVGVGVGVGCLLLGIAVAAYFRRRSKQAKGFGNTSTTDRQPREPQYPIAVRQGSQSKPPCQHCFPTPYHPTAELHNEHRLHELPIGPDGVVMLPNYQDH